jgi:hypothetical protein
MAELNDVDQAVAQLRAALTEATAGFYTDGQLEGFLNEAVAECALRLPNACLDDLASTDTNLTFPSAGVGTLPADYLRFQAFHVNYGSGVVNAQLVRLEDVAAIDLYADQASTQETPVVYVFGGSLNLKPATTPSSHTLFYTASPTVKTSGGTLELGYAYMPIAIHLALAQAFTRSRETDLAAQHLRSANDTIAQLVAEYTDLDMTDKRRGRRR